MRGLLLACALISWLSTNASAQCCGDCGGDGQVTIDDLVTAVRNALDGCSDATPTPTAVPSGTPTNPATPTRTPVRCTRDFSDTSNTCLFNGNFNLGCGKALNASFAVDGSLVVVSIATQTNPSIVSFAAQRDSDTHAHLTGWSSNNFQTTHVTAGSVDLAGGGTQLIVFPNDSPFMILSCNFVQYVGDFVNPRSASQADGSDGIDFGRVRAWSERPPPELTELADQ